MKTIALAAALALAGSLAIGPAQAKHHRHHHKHHGMTMGGSGPSGPGLEPGASDKTRPAGKGVNAKPAG
jgi:hypothetical protein